MVDLSGYGVDVLFNPDMTEVDRVLDVRIVTTERDAEIQLEDNPDLEALLDEEEFGGRGKLVKEFLVKWRGAQYEHATWEVFDDFQDVPAIRKYFAHL